VARADGTVTVVAVADYGDALPHDLAHVVVERELGLRFGFWGLVVAGADLDDHGTRPKPGGGRAEQGATAPRDTDPLVVAHLEELVAAETVANLFHRPESAGLTADASDDEFAQLVPSMSPTEAGRVRRALGDMQRRWDGLEPGASLVVDWP
jgi:hypothetical protein